MRTNERITLFLQARSSSSRLPLKALLSIGGMPLSLLVARRAMNRGRPLLLATSAEASDDALAALFSGAGIPVYRGSLDDPLKRFAEAARGLRDEDWIVRLTGDNPLPDGALIERMIDERAARGLDYLRIDARRSNQPYGVSAEIFRVAHLREAARLARSAYDREHITPFIRRKAGDATLSAETDAPASLAGLRATIDSARDHERMMRVFAGVADPVHEPLSSLIGRLRELDPSPIVMLPDVAPRLMLGTAQLGLDYGIANLQGKPSASESFAILECASRVGVAGLDTARAYGDAERRIGEAFDHDPAIALSVTTKLASLNDAESAHELAILAENSLFRSLDALGMRRVESVLFHRAGDLERFGGAALRRLIALKSEGYFQRLGVSVQTPEEAWRALELEAIGEIQFPLNLLDARFDAFIESARERPEVKVVARSVFLQGLLLMDADLMRSDLPSFPNIDIEGLALALDELVIETRSANRLELALRFVRSFLRLDAIVVGAEKRAQLEAIARAFLLPPLETEALSMIRDRFRALPESFLDPSKWPPLRR